MEKIVNRVTENFSQNKIVFSIFMTVWVIAIAVTLFTYRTTLGKESVGSESYNRTVVEVTKDTKIEETAPVHKGSSSVSVLFATYARNNKGTVHVTVKGENTGNIYVDQYVKVDQIQDNAYYTFEFNKEIDTKDAKVRVAVESDSNEGEGVAVYYANINEFENGSLAVNGESVEDASLCMRYMFENEEFASFSLGIISWTIFGISLIAIIYLLLEPKWETMFALSAFILGTIFMIIIVPASPPDELRHYEIALQVSNKMMFKPDNLVDSVYLKYGGMYGHYNISAGYSRFMSDIFGPLNLTGKLVEPSGSLDVLYLVQYIPCALGLTVGRLLGCNMITTFYIGRMTDLLFYVGCLYWAIKKAPVYKFVIGIIGILPMLLQSASSITYDLLIIGFCFMTFGYLLKWLLSDGLIANREVIEIFIICLILAPAKVVYGLLAFLFWFVPKKNFGSLKRKIIICLILCIPAAIQIFSIAIGPLTLFFKTLENGTGLDNMLALDNGILKAEEPQSYSFSYMFSHPLETLDIFYRTVRYRIKYWFYGALGRGLSGETLILPLRVVHLLVLTVFASAFVKQDRTLPWYMRIFNVLVCAGIGLMVMVGMFVSWTTPGQEVVKDYGGFIIEGIQGRYFCPVLPYFFTVFSNKKIGLPKKSEKFIFLGYLLLIFVVVIYVLSYTFVN